MLCFEEDTRLTLNIINYQNVLTEVDIMQFGRYSKYHVF